MKRPCNYHNTSKGCYKGDKCGFSHDQASSSQGPQQHQNREPKADRPKVFVPNGVCRDFYTTGSCLRGLQCKYSHVQLPQGFSIANVFRNTRGTQPDPAAKLSVADDRLSHVAGDQHSNALMGKLDVATREGEFKALVKQVGKGERMFGGTVGEIYTFVAGLLATTEETVAWTFQDGQGVLADLAKTPGPLISIVRDILAFPVISVNPVRNPHALSFQRGLVPIFLYFASSTVKDCLSKQHANALYTILHNNAEDWVPKTIACLKDLEDRCTLADDMGERGPAFRPSSFVQVIVPIVQVLCQYFTKFDTAIVENPTLRTLVSCLRDLFLKWMADLGSPNPQFKDSLTETTQTNRFFILTERHALFDRLDQIIERAQGTLAPNNPLANVHTTNPHQTQSLIRLQASFSPPGHLRQDGPRHDNDHANICQISILPTRDELLCSIPPFLPGNIPGAPHHLAEGSIEKQLDIIFRLVREDMVGPMRAAIGNLVYKLETGTDRPLQTLLQKGGGRFRSQDDGEAVDLTLYADVVIERVAVEIHQMVVVVGFQRQKGMTTGRDRRRLSSGAMVGMIIKSTDGSRPQTFLGTVVGDLGLAGNRVEVKVSFPDTAAYLHAITDMERQRSAQNASSNQTLFFEIPGFLISSIKPFLAQLQNVDPTEIPFQHYIAGTTLANATIDHVDLPKFARAPNFTYKLGTIFGADKASSIPMTPADPEDVGDVLTALKATGKLDPSQAEAFMSCMTREMALIQGPPGTGKSYVGEKIVEALLASNIGPILVVCLTNHALDQFLEHLLDHITTSIVRCGSQSKSEKIQALNLKDAARGPDAEQSQSLRDRRRKARDARNSSEKELQKLCQTASIRRPEDLSWALLEQYLLEEFPDHFQELQDPPAHILTVFDNVAEEGWQVVGRKSSASPHVDSFTYWREGSDLIMLRDFCAAAKESSEADRKGKGRSLEDMGAFRSQRVTFGISNRFGPIQDTGDDWDHQSSASWTANGSENDDDVTDWASADLDSNGSRHSEKDLLEAIAATWMEPRTSRTLQALREESSVWSFSKGERDEIMRYWMGRILVEQTESYERVRQRHETATTHLAQLDAEDQLSILKQRKIIGCTTNGASLILPLLTAAAPRVLFVEEAGECLEAHSLASLVPSIEQCILIGDPQQLRPQVKSYHLSCDSKQGKAYRLDMSLFERLVQAKMPFSTLQTQRRMRPEISELIRKPLYPALQDGPTVMDYPAVKGLRASSIFVDHTEREDRQTADSSSRSNSYEADMICDLVVYLTKQGYQSGDIAVLTPYLGQLRLLRQKLSQRKFFTEIDERDGAALDALHDDGDDMGTATRFIEEKPENVAVLRTVDNFQGEEAKIVILSLVRNCRTTKDDEGNAFFTEGTSIGFLKSPNRANVALSRAKHGMVIFGNAALFSERSDMWKSVIATIEEQGGLFSGIPIQCEQHPTTEMPEIQRPGDLALVAPQGGCTLPCEYELACGHSCPLVCHPQDRKHQRVRCVEECPVRLPCDHPCTGKCWEAHPPCLFPVWNFELPCGHRVDKLECHRTRTATDVLCTATISSLLPCGHVAEYMCHENVKDIRCVAPCQGRLDCCERLCKAECGSCQVVATNSRNSPRPRVHVGHSCDRPLLCGHSCGGDCQDHRDRGTCGSCTASCENGCDHGRCKHVCGTQSCRTCMDRCSWVCQHGHGRCQNLCSMPCSRLPCDEPCQLRLPCGHPCPSICGETCAFQLCVICATPDQRSQVTDLIMQETLGDFDFSKVDECGRLITLPCKHTFTVETLDGIFELERYYARDGQCWKRPLLYSSSDAPRSCPLCRSPIKSTYVRRYGRAFKAADLAEQEKLTLLRGTSVVNAVSSTLNQVKRDEEGSVARSVQLEQFGLKGPVISRPYVPTVNAIRARGDAHLVSLESIMTGNDYIGTLQAFGATRKFHQMWRSFVGPNLLDLFKKCSDVESDPTPRRKAYDSTFTKMYREKLDALAVTGGPSQPELVALQQTLDEIASAPPQAEIQCCIKACMASMDVRLEIARVTGQLAARLVALGDDEDPKATPALCATLNARMLRFYIRFLLKSCLRDGGKCIDKALEAKAYRSSVDACLPYMSASIAMAKFYIENLERESVRAKTAQSDIDKLVDSCAALQDQARSQIDKVMVALQNSAKGNTVQMRANDEWLDARISPLETLWEREWDGLFKRARQEPRYEEVSDAERRAVAEALLQGEHMTTGHWYQCPNGHSYVIGECGMAMQGSTCPECHAQVGGAHHASFAGNTRDTTMESFLPRGGYYRG